MTAIELALKAKQAKPHVRYAYGMAHGGGCVAAWSETVQRWQAVAGQLIGSGEWYSLEYELLLNGEPVKQEWIEV